MHESLRVEPGFELASVDPGSTPGVTFGKARGGELLAERVAELAELQERLFAESRFGGTRSVLLVLQAMDTAGKGGILSHVFGGLNPQGVQIYSFKAPTDEEKEHDFLWRIRRELPQAGILGVFDRSHYEDVLIHRVRGFSTLEVIESRYGVINEFEDSLVRGGMTVIKVMLHISSEEQKARLEARLADPAKQWKYNPGDVDERLLWPDYMEAYQIALTRTSASAAPWYVVPADHKWYARLAVQSLMLETLRGLDPQWPRPQYDVAVEQARVAAS